MIYNDKLFIAIDCFLSLSILQEDITRQKTAQTTEYIVKTTIGAYAWMDFTRTKLVSVQPVLSETGDTLYDI